MFLFINQIYTSDFDLSGTDAKFATSVPNFALQCCYKNLGKNLLIAERLSVTITFYKSRNEVWLNWFTHSNFSHSFKIVLWKETKTDAENWLQTNLKVKKKKQPQKTWN